MCHIVHLINQFKSLNTFQQSFDYMYIQVYHEIGPEVLEEEIFKFCKCIFEILLSSPFGKRCETSIWKTLKDAFFLNSF